MVKIQTLFRSQGAAGVAPPGGLEVASRQTAWWRQRSTWQMLAPAIVFAVLIIAFSIMSPVFLTLNNILNILQSSAVLLALALGTTAVMLTGSIDLSIGSVLSLSAYAGTLLATKHGNGWLLIIPVVGAGCGAISGFLVALGRLPSFLVTLGGYFAFDGVANYLAGGQPVTLMPSGVTTWFGGYIGRVPIITLWAVAVLIVVVLVYRYARAGRYAYAVGGNERTAWLAGLPVTRVKFYAFVVSGLLAGIGALLEVVRTQAATSEMGQPFLLLAIGAVVLGGTSLSGGTGGPANSVIGVLLIAILSNGMVLGNVNPYIQQVILGVVVVGAVAATIKRRQGETIK